MSATLKLDSDTLLTTTRAVRKRLDFDRKVPRELIHECLQLAFQAPNGGNMNSWRWIVIDDPALVAKAADIYNGGLDDYIAGLAKIGGYPGAQVHRAEKIGESVAYLRENFHRCPALLLPLAAGRTEGADLFNQGSTWGSIIQAVWSFMLALRDRGLGSAWTTGHLMRHADMAQLLSIPKGYTQVGLFPIAYTLGTDFKPAHRRPTVEVIGWNGMP